MKITKEEALALTKMLHPHTDFGSALSQAEKPAFLTILEDLQEKLTAFLLNGEEDCCDHDEEQEEKEDDEETKDELEDEEDDSEEEDEEEGDEDEEEQEVECERYAAGSILHSLTQVKSTGGTLEFEEDEERGTVDLLINGDLEYENVRYVERGAKTLLVARHADDAWISYSVTKFPKDWIKTFPLNVTVGVE